MSSELALRPFRYAAVSGGKDSLYMMQVILAHPEKYPLDMVCHYEVELDHDFSKAVVARIGELCAAVGVEFRRITPTHKYRDLFQRWGTPGRLGRWCNSHYKLSCAEQLVKWAKAQRCRPTAYIGLCADEVRRFRAPVGVWGGDEYQDKCYPLAEEGITEDVVLRWARDMPIFEGYYTRAKRQGCWLCPAASMAEAAFLLSSAPPKFEVLMFFFWKYTQTDRPRKPLTHVPLGEYISRVVAKYTSPADWKDYDPEEAYRLADEILGEPRERVAPVVEGLIRPAIAEGKLRLTGAAE